MIAETLLSFAKLLDGSELIGENCFLFERCEVDFDGFRINLNKAKKGGTVKVPVLLFGSQIRKQVNTFAYNANGRNASITTFDRIENQHKSYLSTKQESSKYTKFRADIFLHKHDVENDLTIQVLEKNYNFLVASPHGALDRICKK